VEPKRDGRPLLTAHSSVSFNLHLQRGFWCHLSLNLAEPNPVGKLELALERARSEASRAKRQYDAVEPENRLVENRSKRRERRGQRSLALDFNPKDYL
jgi:hypothetical protein